MGSLNPWLSGQGLGVSGRSLGLEMEMGLVMSVQTLGDYNRLSEGKAWEVVAVVVGEGLVLCAVCAKGLPGDGDDYSPLFSSSDPLKVPCDKCGRAV